MRSQYGLRRDDVEGITAAGNRTQLKRGKIRDEQRKDTGVITGNDPNRPGETVKRLDGVNDSPELTGGELKVWYIPQIPSVPYEVMVPDLATAKLVLDTLCQFSLFEYENRIKPDYSDMGGIVRFEGGDYDGEWVDVEDDEIAALAGRSE